MNLKNLKLASFALCLVMLSCGKDKDTEKLSGENIIVENPTTPEEHKQNLEKSGETIATEMEGLKSTEAVDVMLNFATLMTQNSDGNMAQKRFLYTPTQTSRAIQRNKSINQMFEALDTTPIQSIDSHKLWLESAGTYIYNAKAKTFVKAEGLKTNNITYIFPSKDGGKTNNAKIIVYEPGWYNGSLKGTGMSDSVSIPTFISAQLTVDGKKILSYDYVLTIDKTTGTISHLMSKMTFGDYSIAYNVDNVANKEFSEKYTFAHLSTTLVELYAGIKGDWTEESITKNEDVPQDMIESVDAYIQLLNVKVNGSIDFKNFEADQNALTEADQNDSTKMADIMNKNMHFSLNYASNNRLIAKVIFGATSNENNPMDNMIFEFSDGSKVVPETYFTSIWDKLTSKLQTMFPSKTTEDNTTKQE